MVHGFAFHRLVLDANGNPDDYVFLEVNPSFEKQTGLRSAEIVGRSLREILPGVASENFRWIETYGRVALGGEPLSFEQYSESLGRWFRVSVIPPA